MQSLNSEAAILSELDHPNVVNYHESFQEDGSLYIVMELADGMSLLDYIHSHAEKALKIPEATVWSIVIQICQALKYIHVNRGVFTKTLTLTLSLTLALTPTLNPAERLQCRILTRTRAVICVLHRLVTYCRSFQPQKWTLTQPFHTS